MVKPLCLSDLDTLYSNPYSRKTEIHICSTYLFQLLKIYKVTVGVEPKSVSYKQGLLMKLLCLVFSKYNHSPNNFKLVNEDYFKSLSKSVLQIKQPVVKL